MEMVLGVRFREVGKIHYFLYSKEDISLEDLVIAETKRGIECGKVVSVKKDYDAESGESEFTENILRKATEEDLDSLEKKKIEEEKAEKICKEKILEHNLKMKIIDVEYMFDRSKLIFYFTSESRVDFRSLVKDLAYHFKVRIELRQVGIRDEAKILGGLGICGKSLCCSSFLNDFQSVTVKMAKDQGVSLNPAKLSGICGRLKCCLNYEQDTYLELIENMPQIGDTVKTSENVGVVIARFPISSSLKVQIEDDAGNKRVKTIKSSDVLEVIENNKEEIEDIDF